MWNRIQRNSDYPLPCCRLRKPFTIFNENVTDLPEQQIHYCIKCYTRSSTFEPFLSRNICTDILFQNRGLCDLDISCKGPWHAHQLPARFDQLSNTLTIP